MLDGNSIPRQQVSSQDIVWSISLYQTYIVVSINQEPAKHLIVVYFKSLRLKNAK